MRDWMHLLRLAALIGAGALAFAAVRPWFVPDTFGDLGHYRAAAVVEARERPVQFADGASCEVCHSDVVTLRLEKKSRHGRIQCQSCHGPLGEHVESAGESKPALPDVATLCVRCHEDTAGRRAVPQVRSVEHSGGERCSTCHSPHTPGLQ